MDRTKQSPKQSPITNEEFNTALAELVAEADAGAILGAHGVYEALSEAWNNDAIDRARANRKEGK